MRSWRFCLGIAEMDGKDASSFTRGWNKTTSDPAEGWGKQLIDLRDTDRDCFFIRSPSLSWSSGSEAICY